VDLGINTPGVNIQWAFAFAAYGKFTSDLTNLDASPIQTDAVAAGTPGNTMFDAFVQQVRSSVACNCAAPLLHAEE
jgi:hypothetical protein